MDPGIENINPIFRRVCSKTPPSRRNLMKAQFRNMRFTLSFAVVLALLTGAAAQAAAIDTAIQLTAAGSTICEVGLCDTASLQAGALNNGGNASSIPTT